MNFHLFKYCFWLSLTLGLCGTACNSTQFLEEGDAYIIENKIEFTKASKDRIKNKSNLGYQLSTLAKQKPNEKFFMIPRQNFWYRSQDSVGRLKIWKKLGQPLGKRLGEKPAIYEESKAQESTEVMRRYLNERGYFQSEVSFYTKYKKKGQKVTVIYQIAPGIQYVVDTLIYQIKDTSIAQILDNIRADSPLQKGAAVDANLNFQETNRITNYLRNNGYYYFSNAYFEQLVGLDSTNGDVALELGILNPKNDPAHQKYVIGEITLYQQGKFTREFLPASDTIINGIRFATNGAPFRVKPSVLVNAITLKKGDVYSKSTESKTLKNLNRLGVFSFVTINAIPDKDTGVLNFEVFLSPNKKWQFGIDWEVNFSERRNLGTTTNLLGLSLNPSLATRNFRKGAESLVLGVDFGLEIDPFASNFSIINNLDFKIQTDWNFPRFVDYFGFWKLMNKTKVVSDKYISRLNDRATSGFSSSYNLQILINRYQLHFGNLSFGYKFQRSSKSYFEVNNAGIDILIPFNDPDFERDVLDQNPFLAESFNSQLFTGFLFRDLNYFYTGSKNEKGHYWGLIGNFEISGLEVWAANKISNAFSSNNTTFSFFGTEFSQFLRLNLDVRRHLQVGPRREFVIRLTTGGAVPFGFSKTVPYVKQFFVGGPQSLRGWNARAVGPGLYVDPITLDPNNRNLFYQTGDVKIEMNLEYRFPLVKVIYPIYGAVFLDIGNIWSLGFADDEEINRPGSAFKMKRTTDEAGNIINDLFLKEMAISAGFGFRWDFNYFVFRLDLGTPIKNNAPDADRNNTYWVNLNNWRFRDIIWNLGLGYPF